MRKLVIASALAIVCLAGCNQGNNQAGGNAGQDTAQEAQEAVELSAEQKIQAAVDTFSYKEYTAIADVLAGKQPKEGTMMSGVAAGSAFASHSKQMNALWDEFKKTRVDVIREWSKQNLTSKTDTVFYPFGGPDFNYLSSFFPDVRYSVLIGIEPAGKVPFSESGAQSRASAIFADLVHSIRYNTRSSFFVTSQMEKDLRSDVKGTLPVIMMFMALHGYEVITVNPIDLNEQGEIVYTEPDKVFAHTLDKNFDKGFEILYRQPGEKGARSLNYLRTDVSDQSYDKSNVGKLVENKFKNQTTMLKAASYLMQTGGFSKIRNSILENSAMIMTGPSGIAYKQFDKDKWDITLYGGWNPPIKDFKMFPQEDLQKAYDKAPKNPINFRYDYGRGAGFFVARKK